MPTPTQRNDPRSDDLEDKMQLTRQTHRPNPPRLQMAAMIDIVFLLLIFFMCTTTFARPEEDLPTQLPANTEASTALDEFDPVQIRLDLVDGAVITTVDGIEVAGDAELRTQLEARRAIANIPAIIQGGGQVPFGEMVRVLDLCYAIGLNRVAYAPPQVSD